METAGWRWLNSLEIKDATRPFPESLAPLRCKIEFICFIVDDSNIEPPSGFIFVLARSAVSLRAAGV
jgi:hypothetical protein